ncbi:hypothetical protein [Nocardia ignorata]|uniref:Mce-associated membrane protein n=1 Tax=Nocardia ignorata TaxID=145285 RepID=A0A4R6P274_NOCIG|nr:hypothetical protein [Nocardia ignorata]TDP31591.1 hypothetical protein DFR75_108196 [Nocardia ignorata]
MSNRLSLAAVTVGIAAVVIALTTVLTGGADDPGPTSDTHTPNAARVEGPEPEGADAVTVAQMGLAAMFSWQPRVDPGPGVGLVRAAPWLTGELAAAARNGPAIGLAPLPEWAGWRASNDIVTALVDTGQAEAGGSGPTVAASVTQQVLHRDGSTTMYRRMRVRVTVTETSQGWRMSSYRITSVTDHG